MMNDAYKKDMLEQLRLISLGESILDQLLSTTMKDHQYGRGFCSAYPSKALDNIKMMRLCIEMELQNER
jgi:hypothetical protein